MNARAEARFALEQWGIWCRTNIGAPRPVSSWMGDFWSNFNGSRVAGDRRPVRVWEDPDCEAFDQHVMRYVRMANQPAFEALTLYYAFTDSDGYHSVSKAALARRLRVSRDTATKRLEIGENMVAAVISTAQ